MKHLPDRWNLSVISDFSPVFCRDTWAFHRGLKVTSVPIMEDTLVDPLQAVDTADLAELVRQLRHGPKSSSFARNWPNCSTRMPNCGNRWDIGRPCTLGRCIGPSNSKPRSNSFAGRTASSKINSSVERVKNLRPRIVPITWKARRMIGSPPPRAKRGQRKDRPGPKRHNYSHLPVIEDTRELPEDQRVCPQCGAHPLAEQHRGFRTNRCRFPGLSAADPAATLSADLHL